MSERHEWWVRATAVLLPREDGRPQAPSRLFRGYYCSNFRFGPTPKGHNIGGAQLFPVHTYELQVGEAGQVCAHLLGWEELAAGLKAGVPFCLTEGGRLVVTGIIHEILDDTPLWWAKAKVKALPRIDGAKYSPPRIVRGYRNTQFRFGPAPTGPIIGGATFYPLDGSSLEVGESGLVYLGLYGLDEIGQELQIGASICFTESGRFVIAGKIIELLDHEPDV
jgi:hypothetical protein